VPLLSYSARGTEISNMNGINVHRGRHNGRPSKGNMSRTTTVLLTLGPRTVGSWSDRAYRVSHTAQMVEGGSAAYWLVTPTAPAENPVTPDIIRIETPDPSDVVNATIMLAAVHAGQSNGQAEGLLLDTHNIEIVDGVRQIAEFWEVEPNTEANLAKALAPYIRMSFTMLDEMNLVTEEVTERLIAYGFDVEVFSLNRERSVA